MLDFVGLIPVINYDKLRNTMQTENLHLSPGLLGFKRSLACVFRADNLASVVHL